MLPITSLDSMLASLAAVLALLAALLVPLLASLAAVVAGSCIRFDHALRFARCVPLLASFAAVLTNANHTLASLAVLNHYPSQLIALPTRSLVNRNSLRSLLSG